MICFPNAKINLGLIVESRRHDGLHNLSTCLIPVPLCDILEIKESDHYSLKVYNNETGVIGNNNIITKSWDLIKHLCPRAVEVLLYKNIPIGSGLGGGSSDAAFFVIETLKMFKVSISSDNLINLLFKIGADCPYFAINNAALLRGAGEQLQEIQNPVKGDWVTILYPGFEVSTAFAFENIREFSSINYDKVLQYDKSSWKNVLTNTFQQGLVDKHPDLQIIIDKLYHAGAYFVSLSGTGSSLFALSNNKLIMTDCDYWLFNGRV